MSSFATVLVPIRILIQNFFLVPTLSMLVESLQLDGKRVFLNTKRFQFLHSRVEVLEMVFTQNHKIQPQISLSRLANVWRESIRYKVLKQPLTGCDTGVIVPRRGKLISLLQSSLGYVSPAAC